MLSEVHHAQLKASAIADEVIAQREYQSLLEPTNEHHGILYLYHLAKSQHLFPGLLLPIWPLDGSRPTTAQLRPDTPRLNSKGKERKYEFPAHENMQLDTPPACVPCLGNPRIPLWITEGQKKGDALVSAGVQAVVVLLGVDCWRGTNAEGGKVALAEWAYVALNGRTVYICFDSDAISKPEVQRARRQLAEFLAYKDAQVFLVPLPSGENEQKQGVDDYLAAGGTVQALTALAYPADEAKQWAEDFAPQRSKAHLPKIQMHPEELDSLAAAGQQAILTWQTIHPPQLFQRAGRLCFIVRDLASEKWLKRPADWPTIQMAPLSKLRAYMNETAAWYKWNERKSTYTISRPDKDIVQTVLEFGQWPFPPLRGIATAPFYRPDGTLCQQRGYDPTTGVYLEYPADAPPLLLPAHPDIFDAGAAITTLNTLLCDFQFAEEGAGLSATLAALLTLVARPAIVGQVPLFAVTSTTPGTGKGLLVDILCLIATGNVAPRWAPSHEAEEERKRLMTIALAGEQVALIDNIQGQLGSEALDMAITSGVVSDRALGSHGLLKAPFTTVLFATGNNMSYRGDTFRRVVPIHLASMVEHPEERNDFAIPHIRAYCRQHQGRLLTAACTILAAFVAAGSPPPPTGTGSFEEWNALIRGAILWAGLPDPLGGQKMLLPQDIEWDAMAQICNAWYACYEEEEILLHRVMQDLSYYRPPLGPRETISEERMIWERLHGALSDLHTNGDGKLMTRVIGKMLSKYAGRFFAGKALVPVGKNGESKLWKIRTI